MVYLENTQWVEIENLFYKKGINIKRKRIEEIIEKLEQKQKDEAIILIEDSQINKLIEYFINHNLVSEYRGAILGNILGVTE